MKELIIIGSGPVGLYAGFLAGLRKIDSIILESSQTVGGQLNLYLEKAIYDIPGFKEIKASELLDALFEQYKTYEKEVPLHLNETVEKIKKEQDYFVVTTNIDSYQTKKILMTHGGGKFTPRLVEGVKANNLKYNVESLDQYVNKKVLVFGGGDSAIDWANHILEVAREVYVVHRRNEFRAHLGSIDLFESRGGKILTPYILCEEVSEDNLIKNVTLEHVETKEKINLDIDEILAFFGLIQSKSVYEDWLIETEHGLIIVNSKMQTSVDGIFACGNGVNYPGKQKMITSGFGEVVTAMGEINFELHPEQKVPQYSSLMKK